MNEQRNINDVSLAAYLTVAGFKSAHPVLVGKYLQFRFEKSQELEDAIERFYLRQTQVDALSLLEAYRTIKAWTSEVKSKGGDRHGN
jgi:hypothetical protein